MMPLFIVTGASCAGKSTLCNLLFQKETEYIVMESDLLWNGIYNTPEDGYRAYRELWLRVCAQISQIGKPVVLCGCCTPEQFETAQGRELFSVLHYLAVVSDDAVFEERMRNGRHVTDEKWIQSSLQFNRWLRDNAARTNPPLQLLDTTHLSPEEAACQLDCWILERIGN